MKTIIKGGIQRLVGKKNYFKVLDRLYEACADRNALEISKKEISPWKNHFAGERCWIFGNGPSLNKMDLELFRDEHTWFSNKAYLLFERISWRPSFYIATDETTILDMADDFREIVTQNPGVSFFSPAGQLVRAGIGKSENLYRPRVRLSKFSPEEGNPAKKLRYFSKDCGKVTYSLKTITATTMQLAVYMGFKRIYLVGCDADYRLHSGVRQKHPGTQDLELASRVVSTDDNDILHFDKNYFRKGSSWTLPDADTQLMGFRIAKLGCERQAVKIFNAGVGGKLELFPRVAYQDVLAGRHE
jgi:hypothetical protein